MAGPRNLARSGPLYTSLTRAKPELVIAVLTHLRAQGFRLFFLICPAAVVTNWVREVAAKSKLHAHRVHGPGRDAAARNWIRRCGVAVTTFVALGCLEHTPHRVPDLGCVVIDEAHYIRTPRRCAPGRATRRLDACGSGDPADREAMREPHRRVPATPRPG